MLEFIVDRCLAQESHFDDRQCTEAIRKIHAEWLMTPRADLMGETPRDWLLKEYSRLETDLHHRADQWSRQGFPPPALDETSGAYRFGGFGTIEVVIYFHLMRTLISVAWDRLSESDVHRETLISQLADLRDRELDQQPDDGSSGYTNRELIEFERKRMPIISDGTHLFDDCPLCRAVAEQGIGRGPTFLWYDAHELELEDEFAFSTILSRAEWEQEQREMQQFLKPIDRKQLRDESLETESTPPIWSSSFVDWDLVRETDPSQLTLAIGFPLSELISDLQADHVDRAIIDSLQESYATFRRSEDPIALRSSSIFFKQQLEDVAGKFPKLISKSADLQSLVDDVLRLSD